MLQLLCDWHDQGCRKSRFSVFTFDKHTLLPFVFSVSTNGCKLLDNIKEKSLWEKLSECEVPGGGFFYLYALVISFFKLSIRAELEVFFFDLYPTQTTTSLHTTKFVSGETSGLLAHEKKLPESTFTGHIESDTRPCVLPLWLLCRCLHLGCTLKLYWVVFFHQQTLYIIVHISSFYHWVTILFIAILTLFCIRFQIPNRIDHSKK